ncbi:Protein-L-isoaspartate O-methyltransferase [Streptomyces sp. cf124]|uniref:protein-L-isoaspartate O-methyltransferase family protein n=1 Tax=Streptomyces sp. cf124 TaxID=1761903 RepID=UPI0008EFFFEC|nr:Protein-L-isoaspartate O-methyltransferase [Streptomyces sp. cf124]
MEWLAHAQRLAREVVRPESRWHSAVATVPRHTYVPRWWEADGDVWILRDGQSNPDAWLENVYTDTTLVTRVDTCHADTASIEGIGIISDGTPTSSSTLPSLVVRMYRHAMIADDNQILVTTGTGYGTALACARLGSDHVTSVDVDEWLVNIAQDRLSLMGERPRVEVCDITGPLPGEYDRIVATVSVRRVPVSWLQALRRGGRFVTTLAGTGLILTADKTEDGGAVGRIEWDRAGFMPTRQGDDYEHPADDVWRGAMKGEGEVTSTSRYPLLYPPDAWDVMSMLALNLPPASTTGTPRTATPARCGCSTRTGHGLAPQHPGSSTRPQSIRAARGACGTSWSAYGTGSTARARCRSTGRRPRSTRTAPSPSRAARGR